MRLGILIPLITLAAWPVCAETRAWRSADGGKRIEGSFVRSDAATLTIRRADQREVTIPLEKLHHEDLAWLRSRHSSAVPAPSPTERFVFDKLAFGDSRAEVMQKLSASTLVTATQPEALLSRTGLNGVYRTRQKLGGLDATLYFDWCGNGGLREITLQTSPLKGEAASSRLEACWRELIGLLTTLHGQPINAHDKFDLAAIPDGSMSATHLWKLDPHGTAMLGAAREGDGCQIAVRFTTEEIKPVIIPDIQADPP